MAKGQFKSQADAQDKFQRRVAQAGPDYQKGVQNASNWSANAQAAAPRRNAGLQQAIADGRIDAGIARTGDAGWKSATLGKGVNNFTQAAAKAGAKYAAGYGRLVGYLNAAQQATANMDTSTRAGRIAKASAWQQIVGEQSDADKGRR